MNNSNEQTADLASSSAKSLPRRSRSLLLWLASGFWLLSGVAGLVPILLVIPTVPQMPLSTLLFVAMAALSHVLSLWGAILLLRCKRSAIPLLVVVFVLGLTPLLLTNTSPVNWDTFTKIVWCIAIATIGYAMLLRRRGVLI